MRRTVSTEPTDAGKVQVAPPDPDAPAADADEKKGLKTKSLSQGKLVQVTLHAPRAPLETPLKLYRVSGQRCVNEHASLSHLTAAAAVLCAPQCAANGMQRASIAARVVSTKCAHQDGQTCPRCMRSRAVHPALSKNWGKVHDGYASSSFDETSDTE